MCDLLYLPDALPASARVQPAPPGRPSVDLSALMRPPNAVAPRPLLVWPALPLSSVVQTAVLAVSSACPHSVQYCGSGPASRSGFLMSAAQPGCTELGSARHCAGCPTAGQVACGSQCIDGATKCCKTTPAVGLVCTTNEECSADGGTCGKLGFAAMQLSPTHFSSPP